MNLIRFFALCLSFLGLALSQEEKESTLLLLDAPLRVKSSPNEFIHFKIHKNGWKPNSIYNIKVSWLGSVGVQMKIYWKSEAENEKSQAQFKPLDTEKFEFQTNEAGIIQGECSEIANQQEYCNLTIVGYRSTRSRDLKAKLDPFEYILKTEEVVFDGVPSYVLNQFILIILISTVLSLFLWRSYSLPNGYLNDFFTNNSKSSSSSSSNNKKNN